MHRLYRHSQRVLHQYGHQRIASSMLHSDAFLTFSSTLPHQHLRLNHTVFHSKRPTAKETKHKKHDAAIFDYSQIKRSKMISNREVHHQKDIIKKMVYILKLLEKSLIIEDSFSWEHDPLVFIDTLLEFHQLLHHSMYETYHDMIKQHGMVVAYFGAFAFDMVSSNDGFSPTDILDKYEAIFYNALEHPIYGNALPENRDALFSIMKVMAARHIISGFTAAHLSTMVEKSTDAIHDFGAILDLIFDSDSLLVNPAAQITHGQLLIMVGSNYEGLVRLQQVKDQFHNLPSPLLDFYIGVAKRNLKYPQDTLLDDFNRAEKGIYKIVKRYNAIQLPWMNELKYEVDLGRAHILFSMGDNAGGLRYAKRCMFIYEQDIRAYELVARSILLFHVSLRQEKSGMDFYLYFDKLSEEERDQLALALVYINKALRLVMDIAQVDSLPVNESVKTYLLIRERLLRINYMEDHPLYERALYQRTRDMAHIYNILNDQEHNIVSQLATELDKFYNPEDVNELFQYLSGLDPEPYKNQRARQLSQFIKSSNDPLARIEAYDELNSLIDVNGSSIRFALSEYLQATPKPTTPLSTIMLFEQLDASNTFQSFIAKNQYTQLDGMQEKLVQTMDNMAKNKPLAVRYPYKYTMRLLRLRLRLSELVCASNLDHIEAAEQHIRLIELIEKHSPVIAQLAFARFLFIQRQYVAGSTELRSLIASPVTFPDMDVDLADAYALSAEHVLLASIWNEQPIPFDSIQNEFMSALQADPYHASSLYYVGLCALLPHGDLSTGLRMVDSLIARHGAHPRYHLLRGLLLFNLHDFQSALDDFHHCTDIDLVRQFIIPLTTAHLEGHASSFDEDAFLSVAATEPSSSLYFRSSNLTSSSPSLHWILPHPSSLFNHWWA